MHMASDCWGIGAAERVREMGNCAENAFNLNKIYSQKTVDHLRKTCQTGKLSKYCIICCIGVLVHCLKCAICCEFFLYYKPMTIYEVI